MALNSTNVRVAGNGELRVAALGTAAPTSATAVLPSAWTGLGYTVDDGVSISTERETEEITAWQSATPVRIIPVSTALEVSTTFLESKAKVIELWWGSAFEDDAEAFRADMAATPVVQEMSLVVDWQDGAINSRLYIPRVTVSETGEVALSRTEAVGFEMTFSALAPASGPLASWFTDDPSVAPAA